MYIIKIIHLILFLKVLKIGSIPIPIRNSVQNSVAPQKGNLIQQPLPVSNKGPSASSSHQGYREGHMTAQQQIREVRQVLYHPAEADHKINYAHHSEVKRNQEPQKFTVEWSMETPERAKPQFKQPRPTQPQKPNMRDGHYSGATNNFNINYIKDHSKEGQTIENSKLKPLHQELSNQNHVPSAPIHFHILHNERYLPPSQISNVNTQLMNLVPAHSEVIHDFNLNVSQGKLFNPLPQIELDLELGDETFETKMEVEEL